jgi:hypothetical protein
MNRAEEITALERAERAVNRLDRQMELNGDRLLAASVYILKLERDLFAATGHRPERPAGLALPEWDRCGKDTVSRGNDEA